MKTNSLRERAWLALHSMPRRADGEPPTYAEVERSERLANATLSALFRNKTKTLDATTLFRLARAMHVSAEWLQEGVGEPPVATGPIPPLPGESGPVELDAREIALAYHQDLGEQLLQQVRQRLDARRFAIRPKTPREWGAIIAEEVQDILTASNVPARPVVSSAAQRIAKSQRAAKR